MIVRTLRVGALLAVVWGMVNTAQASMDSGGCVWGAPGCLLQGMPFLDADNNTNDNLLRLLSARKHLPLPLYPFPDDVTHIRSVHFGDHYDVVDQQIDATSGAEPLSEAEKTLRSQMATLGLTMDDNTLASAAAQSADNTTFTNDDSVLEGRLVSNNALSASQFIGALQAETTLTGEQRKWLAQQRLSMLMDQAASLQPDGVNAPDPASAARAFVDYLTAAQAFYKGDYAPAMATFTRLKDSKQVWVAQTSAYMRMRTALNMSTQNAADEYNAFDVRHVDKVAAQQARTLAQAYLDAWPKGDYVASTNGLMRRIDWYLEDWASLGPRYEAAVNQATSADELQAIISENDNKFQSRDSMGGGDYFVSDAKAPLLTFIQSLRLLREGERKNEHSPHITADTLAQYKTLLTAANMAPLWAYLNTAWLYWQQRDYAAVVAAVTPRTDIADDDVLAFSQQVLYGYGLMAQKQWPAALSHWQGLLKHTHDNERRAFLQMQVAAVQVYSGNVPAIFASDSQVNNLRYRSLVLKTVASPELLRQQVVQGMNDEERTIALHTLLMRDLMAGQYQAWLNDKVLISHITHPVRDDAFSDVNLSLFDWDGQNAETGYTCHSIDETVQALSRNADDLHGLNCLGEFIRAGQAVIAIDQDKGGNSNLDVAIDSQKPTLRANRMAWYQRIIHDPKAEPEDRSFALYRAVMCYAPSGYSDCGGEDIEKSMRKQWFTQLHSQYPGNKWAEKLRYYW